MDTSSGDASVFADVLESEAGGGAAGGGALEPAADLSCGALVVAQASIDWFL